MAQELNNKMLIKLSKAGSLSRYKKYKAKTKVLRLVGFFIKVIKKKEQND